MKQRAENFDIAGKRVRSTFGFWTCPLPARGAVSAAAVTSGEDLLPVGVTKSNYDFNNEENQFQGMENKKRGVAERKWVTGGRATGDGVGGGLGLEKGG